MHIFQMTRYSKFSYFLKKDYVPQEEKHNIVKGIVPMISAQECFKKIDAQVSY